MARTVECLPEAAKELRKLDAEVARRLPRFIGQRVRPLAGPRSIGEALRGGRLSEFWNHRAGDYRIICRIEGARIVIDVVRIGHRAGVYRD